MICIQSSTWNSPNVPICGMVFKSPQPLFLSFVFPRGPLQLSTPPTNLAFDVVPTRLDRSSGRYPARCGC